MGKEKIVRIIKITEMVAFLVAAIFAFVIGVLNFTYINGNNDGGINFFFVFSGLLMLASAAGLGIFSVMFLLSVFGKKSFDGKFEYILASIVPLVQALTSIVYIIVLIANNWTVGAGLWMNFLLLGACGAVILVAFFVKNEKLGIAAVFAAVLAEILICVFGGGEVINVFFVIAISVALLCFAELKFLPLICGQSESVEITSGKAEGEDDLAE